MMRNFIWILPCLMLILLLPGCSTRTDQAINESFDDSAEVFDKEQTAQVMVKVKAVTEVMDYECQNSSSDCGAAVAFSKMMAANYISDIESQGFNRERPKTAVDVQLKAMDKVDAIVTGLTTFGIVKTVADEKPGNIYKNAGDVSNSGNPSEAHTTVSGDKNNGLTTAIERDNDMSTNTGIVEPEPEVEVIEEVVE